MSCDIPDMSGGISGHVMLYPSSCHVISKTCLVVFQDMSCHILFMSCDIQDMTDGISGHVMSYLVHVM